MLTASSCLLAKPFPQLLKTEFDTARIIYNRFVSAISQKPTIATVLSPDVSVAVWCESLGGKGLRPSPPHCHRAGGEHQNLFDGLQLAIVC